MRAGRLLAGALLCAIPALAHHSAAAEYDLSRTVKISGTIAKVAFTNPHATFSLDVTNPDGTVTQWNVEGASPNFLMRNGITRDSFAKGTTVVVDAYPAKDGSPKATGRTLTLADGRELSLRNSDRFDGCAGIIPRPEHCITIERAPAPVK
jgi:hypothetical protein